MSSESSVLNGFFSGVAIKRKNRYAGEVRIHILPLLSN